MSTCANSPRDMLKKHLHFLPVAPIESVNETICAIWELVRRMPPVGLDSSEFTSLIYPFNQRPSHFVISSIFKILMRVDLTSDQILLFLNCHQKPIAAGGPYSTVNWSFLDKPVCIKSTFIGFLGRLARNSKFREARAGPEAAAEASEKPDKPVAFSSVDVIQVLFFLFDDENIAIRVKSYASACRIVKREKKFWGDADWKKFKRAIRYIGVESMRLLRKEHAEKERKKMEKRAKVTRVAGMLRVKVKLGQIIRHSAPCIQILKNDVVLEQVVTKRKYTTVYMREAGPIALVISDKDRVIFRKTYKV
ncbi:uncharacterized protein NEMAJ01_0113 [Nematocida major]|uniref:uncharacterized protein n=1 Tax=Nematocida major TaxID=1912982 RepID=UPI002008B5D3|nr:uncharacterized protein NEMAJ01_0113 [Nematocida major]KAH9385217.1 hypothetical protein NEMAJ01_0113 [Nematocida major]